MIGLSISGLSSFSHWVVFPSKQFFALPSFPILGVIRRLHHFELLDEMFDDPDGLSIFESLVSKKVMNSRLCLPIILIGLRFLCVLVRLLFCSRRYQCIVSSTFLEGGSGDAPNS